MNVLVASVDQTYEVEPEVQDIKTTAFPTLLPLPHMEQLEILNYHLKLCQQQIENSTSSDDSLYCPPVWDGILCWPSTEPNTSASAPCPSYIHGFNPEAFTFKRCMEDGTWFFNRILNTSWTNYSLCSGERKVDVIEKHTPYIRLIAQVGYSLSLLILLVAIIILALFKKLRCPRNNLHMQLFLSFIMRALLTLLKDVVLYDKGIGAAAASVKHKSSETLLTSSSGSVDCKIFISFWHYFLMANYCWIFMEGLYLHNLVFLSMFTDTSGIFMYIIIGWGFPLLFIIPWVIVRALLEDHLCWTLNENKAYFWIIRAPITLTILVNEILFVNIIRVLFLKMFSSQAIQNRQYRYRKWFKSTLVLVPLFGVHYGLLLAISFVENQVVHIVWLYLDQTFSSFQGLFVALLYCFLNGEVQSEIRKICQRFNTNPNQLFQTNNSLLTQSLTYLSKGRSSVQSLHSSGDRRDNYNTPNSLSSPTNKETLQQVMAPQLSPKASALSLGEDMKHSSETMENATELDHRPTSSFTTLRNSPTTENPGARGKMTGSTEYENLLNAELNHRNEEGSFQRESIL